MPDKLSPKEKAAVGVTAAGGGLLAVGLNRQRLQSKIDPNLISLRGGQTAPKPGVKATTTVFDTQRKAWARKFEEAGYKTEQFANFDVNRGGPRTRYFLPGKHRLTPSPSPGKRPLVELELGRNFRMPHTLLPVERLLTGKQKYRVFTDFGPASQKSGVLYKKFSPNWMYAPKGPWYQRNVVPGGDVLLTGKANKPNINVKTIPTSDVFEKGKSIKATTPGRKTFTMMAGTGYVWDVTLPGKQKDLDQVVKALDTKYGKNYRLNILGGPNVGLIPGGYDKMFEAQAKARPDTVKYIPKTDLKGVRKLYQETDVALMAPGSMMSEMATLEGYKPRTIALRPHKEKHFIPNIEWLQKRMGGVQRLDTNKFTVPDIVRAVSAVEEQAAPTTKAIRFESKDVHEIVRTARKDLEASKKFTKKLKVVGGVGAAIGATALATSQIKRKLTDRQIKKEAAAIDTSNIREDTKKLLKHPATIAAGSLAVAGTATSAYLLSKFPALGKGAKTYPGRLMQTGKTLVTTPFKRTTFLNEALGGKVESIQLGPQQLFTRALQEADRQVLGKSSKALAKAHKITPERAKEFQAYVGRIKDKPYVEPADIGRAGREWHEDFEKLRRSTAKSDLITAKASAQLLHETEQDALKRGVRFLIGGSHFSRKQAVTLGYQPFEKGLPTAVSKRVLKGVYTRSQGRTSEKIVRGGWKAVDPNEAYMMAASKDHLGFIIKDLHNTEKLVPSTADSKIFRKWFSTRAKEFKPHAKANPIETAAAIKREQQLKTQYHDNLERAYTLRGMEDTTQIKNSPAYKSHKRRRMVIRSTPFVAGSTGGGLGAMMYSKKREQQKTAAAGTIKYITGPSLGQIYATKYGPSAVAAGGVGTTMFAKDEKVQDVALMTAGGAVGVEGTKHLYRGLKDITPQKRPRAFIYGGAQRLETVSGFEPQAKRLAEELKARGIDVTHMSERLPAPVLRRKDGKIKFEREPLAVPTGRRSLIEAVKARDPDVLIVAKGGEEVAAPGAIEKIKKKTKYPGVARLVTDYGRGNVETREAAGRLNTMAFPPVEDYPHYEKIVAPDKALEREVGKGRVLNIKNLGTNPYFEKIDKVHEAPKPSGKLRAFVYTGSGHQYGNLTRGDFSPAGPLGNIHRSLQAQAAKSGKKLDLHIITGNLGQRHEIPIPGTYAMPGAEAHAQIKKTFKGAKDVKIHDFVKEKDLHKFYTEFDRGVIMPGSSVGEMTSLKGYKTPILAITPEINPETAHFPASAARAEKHIPTVTVGTKDLASGAKLDAALTKLEGRAKGWDYVGKQAPKPNYDEVAGWIRSKSQDLRKAKGFRAFKRIPAGAGLLALGAGVGYAGYKNLKEPKDPTETRGRRRILRSFEIPGLKRSIEIKAVKSN